jgi:two-component system, sensor histidine kinase and response regulator
MNELSAIPASYDYRLVALSVLISILASYAALDLAGRVNAARNTSRLMWLLGGAIAMGTGIWSMHYTGMLAYRMSIPVYYHIPTVFLSWVAAVFASFVALFIVSRESIGGLHITLGSLIMGAAIGAMHYTGMAAMRLSAMHHWDAIFVIASLGIAVVVSLAALILTFLLRDEQAGMPVKLACSLLMGAAVPAMHYTAMAAVSYTPMGQSPDLTLAVDISRIANAAIIGVTFVLLGSVFFLSRRSILESSKAQLAPQER